MEQSQATGQEYYLLFRNNYRGVDGRIGTGFVTSESYTLKSFQKLHPEAVIDEPWLENNRTLWLVSAETLCTLPKKQASLGPATEQHKDSETTLLEETRIYWTSLSMNIYERLNTTGRILVHQYLQEKPWSKHTWSWKAGDQGVVDFRRSVLNTGFKDEKGVEHLEKLGERLKSIYSYPMNHCSGANPLVIPDPPKKSKSKMPSYINGILDLYRELTVEGHFEVVTRLGNLPWMTLLHAKRADHYDSFKSLLSEIHTRSYIDDIKGVVEEVHSKPVYRISPASREVISETEPQEEKTMLLKRVVRIYCDLNGEGLDRLEAIVKLANGKDTFFTFSEKLSMVKLHELVPKMEIIAADPANLMPGAAKLLKAALKIQKSEKRQDENKKLRDTAVRIYKNLNHDKRRKAYVYMCNYFWGGYTEALKPWVEALPSAIEGFRKDELESLVELLEKIRDESDSQKTPDPAPAVKNLSMGEAIDAEKARLRLENEMQEKLEKAEQEKEKQEKETVEKETAEEKERLALASEVVALFNDLSTAGREEVAGLMVLLPWIEVDHNGALTGQAFRYFIRSLKIIHIKKLLEIVMAVHSIPSNQCLRSNTSSEIRIL